MDKQKWTMPKISHVLNPLVQFLKDQFQILGRSDSAGGNGSVAGSEMATFRQYFSNVKSNDGSIRNVLNTVSDSNSKGQTFESTRKITAVPSNRAPGVYKVRRIEIKKDVPPQLEMLNLS